jgi:hypothetical protein
MLTDEDIVEIGEALEHGGFSDDQIDSYLEHYGVKGMRWGQRRAAKAVAVAKVRGQKQDRFGNRNNDKAQRIIDRQKAVAKGKAGTLDKLRVLNTMTINELAAESFSLKDASAARIERAKRTKREITAGKKRITDKLSRLGGYDIRELKY